MVAVRALVQKYSTSQTMVLVNVWPGRSWSVYICEEEASVVKLIHENK